MNRYLDLKIHPYAVMLHGEPVAFFSTLICAAQVASWRGGTVENLGSGQAWLRHSCLDIASTCHVIAERVA